MNSKLIKLSDTHYIIVDDSEIKEGDRVYNSKFKIGEIKLIFNELCYVSKHKSGGSITTPYKSNLGKDCKKITHSTQPIETVNGMEAFILGGITPLELSEVEEIVYGYNPEKIAVAKSIEMSIYESGQDDVYHGYIAGFKAHQELTKDKLFTIEDMKRLFYVGIQLGINQELHYQLKKPLQNEDEVFQRVINDFLPKTEWYIEFDEQGEMKKT